MKRFFLLLCVTAVSLRADVTLPAIFSDRAVLQKSDRVPVWGKAVSGESVTVTLGRTRATTAAAADGRWRLELNLAGEGPGPHELMVQGRNRLVIKDVLIGEVWLCSGQSNMELTLARAAGATEELARPADPQLRQFQVKANPSPVPLDDVDGVWAIASPVSSGSFTAVGYFFGRRLREELRSPVGLINASVGGTYLEAWTRAEALEADPLHKPGKDRAVQAYQDRERYMAAMRSWIEKNGRQDRATADPAQFAAPGAVTEAWKPLTLPGAFAPAGLPETGAVWLRRKIEITPAQANKNLDLFLGDLRGANLVYWNGQKVGESDLFALERRYTVRASLVQAGEAVLAVRVFNSGPGGGIAPGDTRFRFGSNSPLAGEWLGKPEFALPPLAAAARAELPVRPDAVPYAAQNVAGFLYNGMIHPLVPYALRGFLWYQGEHNWNRGYQYRTGFPLLINDWRAQWGRGDIPFYFCQLPNYQAREKTPGQSSWAEVREAQSLALTLPHTGQAVLMDVGEEGDIHPVNKKDPGERLALLALADSYGKNVVASGPVYAGMSVEGARVRVRFKPGAGALVAKALPADYRPLAKETRTVPLIRNSPDAELEGFAVCGEDRKWKWADARIDGGDVLVWSPEVSKPVAVRYAWAQNPVCNLVNAAGLPAAPFRTDDFPLTSLNTKY